MSGVSRTYEEKRKYLTKAEATQILREASVLEGVVELSVTSTKVIDGKLTRFHKVYECDPLLKQRWIDKYIKAGAEDQEFIKKTYSRLQRMKSLQNLGTLTEYYVRSQISKYLKDKLTDILLEADHMVPVVEHNGWSYYLKNRLSENPILCRVKSPPRSVVQASGMSHGEYVLKHLAR